MCIIEWNINICGEVAHNWFSTDIDILKIKSSQMYLYSRSSISTVISNKLSSTDYSFLNLLIIVICVCKWSKKSIYTLRVESIKSLAFLFYLSKKLYEIVPFSQKNSHTHGHIRARQHIYACSNTLRFLWNNSKR